MSLRRNRRRKRDQRRHHEAQPTRRSEPVRKEREVDDASLLPGWSLGSSRELEAVYGTPQRAPSDDLRDVDHAPRTIRSSSRVLQEAREVERLAYSRRQAAEALGVSISTIDRRVVPSIDTVKLPWGQRLIPVDELERFVRSHLAPARGRPARRPAGRPPTLPPGVVDRIRLECAHGRSLAEIARALTADGVPTAHGGRQWWASTVRAVLVSSNRPATVRLAIDSVSVTPPRAESGRGS